MSHIEYRKTTRAEATDPKWLAVGAQVGQVANLLSARSDLVAYVGPGAGGVAPACYTPATAEVEVNVDVAFGKGVNPEDIGDIRVRSTQFEWPKATGAIFHEALHARFSHWDIIQAQHDLTPAEFRALILLEEGRIEANGVKLFPENKGFLRACALELVIADINEGEIPESPTKAAAALAALVLARVDAGVLQDDDVDGLRAAIIDKLGADTVSELRPIWMAVQEYDKHSDATGMYELAREWVRVINKRAEENGEDPEDDTEVGPGGITAGALADLLDELENASGIAAIGAFEDLADQQTTEEWQEHVKDKAAAAREEREHKQDAADVFGQGTGPMPDNPTGSYLMSERPPTGAERAAAVKIGQLLDKARYRERDAVELHSELPPGRLRTRAMVQGAALKSKGIMSKAEPWRRTVRKHTDDPKLTIGVLVDISGSMGAAMEPMAATAWVMSEAVRRVQGRAAMVYFGTGVFPTLKPGQHLDNVKIYSAPDGTEKFNKAFKALNGSLDLINGTGARMLVVVSDGCYTPNEEQSAAQWVRRCTSNGVGVLWLTMGDKGPWPDKITSGTSAVVVRSPFDAATAAVEVGRAAARALESVN